MMDIKDIIKIFSFIFIFISLISGRFFLEITISTIVLLIIFHLFWKENTPPVIVAALLFQWLSITIGYLYLTITDAKMIDLLWRPFASLKYIDKAFWLSIFGLLFFALGMKLSIINIKERKISLKFLEQYDTLKIIIFYVLYTAFSSALFKAIRFVIPGLSQPVNMLSYFKWSLLFIMVYVAMRKRERLSLLATVLGIEVLIGFTGYFSEFKEILIMLPVIYLTFNKIKDTKEIVFLTLFAVILFNIGVVWSYVKVEYRQFLSGGERAQIVVVDKQTALNKLFELTSKVNSVTYQMGLEALIKRIFSIEYFSATINYIPDRKPYMEGKNWENAVKHVLMPRLFFPNKQAIDDSKTTMELTGIQLADASKGTSISVGYMAQAYADYGPAFMFVPIFLLGLIIGWFYKYFLRSVNNPLWSYALIFPMYFLININGKNIVKITGNLFMYFLVFYLIVKFILPFIDHFIRTKE